MTLATSWRRGLGVLVTSISLVALGMSFGAPQASAHTGDLAGVAVCRADGTYKVPVKLTTTRVPAGNSGSTMWKLGTTSFQGAPTSAAGMHRGPVASVGNTTVTLGTLTFPGTTTVNPWVYAYTTWSPDGFKLGSDGQITGMDGSCIPNNPGPRTVVGTVQDGRANCTTHEVEQFRIDTTIPQIWDATAKAYVDDPDKTHWTTVRVDLPSRPMTADEVKACPVDVPPNPGPRTVTVATDVDQSVSCAEGTKLVEYDTYSVPQVLVDGKYVDDPSKSHWKLTAADVKSVKLTAAEKTRCNVLPHTGTDVGPALGVGVGLMAYGILLWLFGGGRRRRAEG